jgi:hypothetical protein
LWINLNGKSIYVGYAHKSMDFDETKEEMTQAVKVNQKVKNWDKRN